MNPPSENGTWIAGQGTAVYLPAHFEPSYSYPVVVWLEESKARNRTAGRWFPLVSNRNAMAVSLLAPDVGEEVSWKGEPEMIASYVKGLLAEFAAEVKINTRKVILAGQRDGAIAAWKILCASPRQFAGAVLLNPQGTGHVPAGELAGKTVLYISRDEDLEVCRLLKRAGAAITSVCQSSRAGSAKAINHWLMSQLATSSETAGRTYRHSR